MCDFSVAFACTVASACIRHGIGQEGALTFRPDSPQQNYREEGFGVFNLLQCRCLY